MKESIRTDNNRLRAFVESDPLLRAFRERETEFGPVYLVGGAVRDGLLGRDTVDLDLVVEGDAAAVALAVDPAARIHERFGTAEIAHEDGRVDIAGARAETYARPGTLPDVHPADLARDLGRRDFTVNAMAVDLASPDRLIDPHGGRDDLEHGRLRILHPRSFVDDPTRALRAARYAARFGFELEAGTADAMREVDLTTISEDRLRAELRLIAAEEQAVEGLRMAVAWGLIEVGEEDLGLAAEALRLLGADPWAGTVTREDAVLAALLSPDRERLGGLATTPDSPHAAVLGAERLTATDRLLARAAGAEWLDRYMDDWRRVKPEIDGQDLLDRGLRQGPAIGAALEAVRAAKLDRGLEGREAELEVALAAAEAAGEGGSTG